ncbi:MAG: acyl-CoA dehydrogenase family protein [Actinomycetota bacterium]
MSLGADLFTAEHDALRTSVRAFVERELLPHAEEWEAAGSFPKEIFRRAGDLGFLGLKLPEELGGSGPDLVADAVVTEELARCGSGGVAASFGAHKDLAMLYLYNYGSPAQHERWLIPSAAGELVGALAVTEPDTGSDVAAIKTSARRENGGWTITGTKSFITNGAWADHVIVAARTDPDADPARDGISLFVVDATAPGFAVRPMPMLGWRTSQTGELSLRDVHVPDAALLGEAGRGFYSIMRNFAWERMVMALGQVAGAQVTYELAKAYALGRNAFGRPVGKFQVWRHRFADMATRIEAGRALAYHALRLFARGDDPAREAAMAKLYTSEVAFHVADECMQVHGGYGYMMEFAAQRAWRDARLGPIGGGTSEIMRELIAKTYGL